VPSAYGELSVSNELTVQPFPPQDRNSGFPFCSISYKTGFTAFEVSLIYMRTFPLIQL